ncbi:MAG TPA: RHS repeat domain-containing protein [Pyrinomonadaceae bacterium]|nr:RHS repeat domain-containing protein [Pyrinomonadaceae bacterium]
MKHFILLLIFFIVSGQTATKRESDREYDGFVGPVKKVFVTWTPISGSPYPPESKCRQMTNEYDQSGRLTRHSVYPNSCGSDEIREDYTYSADGDKTIKVQEIRGENSPPSPPPVAAPANAKIENGPPKEARRYDDAGRLVEKGLMLPSGKFRYKSTYTYDAKGRLVETTGYDGDDRVTSRRVYAYSGDQRVPSSFIYYGGDGKIYEQTTYTDYEFNSKGDWIKRKHTTEETFNRRRVSMFHREIEYYP